MSYMLQNNTTLVASIFFIEPTKSHYLKKISRDINLAHTSVKKHLQFLEEKKIILKSIEQKGLRLFPLYKANLEGENYKNQKSLYNLSLLKSSKLINFIDDKLSPKSITLFGSFLRGEDTEDSDIDLFIESNSININLKKFEKQFKRKIQLHFENSFLKLPIELKNNIINGIVLRGYLKGYDNKNSSR